jgi:hypothetical protein
LVSDPVTQNWTQGSHFLFLVKPQTKTRTILSFFFKELEPEVLHQNQEQHPTLPPFLLVLSLEIIEQPPIIIGINYKPTKRRG